MTKTIARFLVAGAAASALVLPAAPASAGCSVTIQECIDELLGSTETAAICIPRGHTPPLCLSGSTA